MDGYSRYVLSWAVSVTVDSDFCVSARERARICAQPEIFNSDPGAQFTSVAFTERLLGHGIRLSMDGRGRVFDNIFVERLWRSMKDEDVYIKEYRSVQEAINSLRSYFEFYNRERLHHALNYQTPETVYRQGRTCAAAAT
jgi:putative transposase